MNTRLLIYAGVVLIIVATTVYSLRAEKEYPVLLSFTPTERASPYDRILEKDILVMNDKVIINVKDAEWATFTDTNSMDPVLDAGANAIQIIPHTESDIHVGDIISYYEGSTGNVIIHRVIEIGSDEQGIYYIVKGDNNPDPDPAKVRFSQIRRVVIAIIY